MKLSDVLRDVASKVEADPMADIELKGVVKDWDCEQVKLPHLNIITFRLAVE